MVVVTGWRSAAAAFGRWRAAEQGRRVLFLPVALAAGVAIYMAAPVEPPAWLAPASAALGALAAWRFRARPVPSLCLAFAASACLGATACGLAARFAPPWQAVPRGAVAVTGVVSLTELLPAGARVTLEQVSLEAAPFGRVVRVRLRGAEPPPPPGTRIRLRALLRPPAPPAYPGGWDMRRDAFFSGMGAYGFALGPVEILQKEAGERDLGRLRAGVAARAAAALPGERGAIAAALLTGKGAAIPPGVRADFAATGLAHILAVAGLHVGIVMGCFWGAARALFALSPWAMVRLPVPRLAALVGLAGGAAYLLLAGGHLPVRRALLMAALATLAALTGRRAASLRALALVATLLILADPASVMGVGFQMSFAAVLALIAVWEALRPWFSGLLAGRAWRAPAAYLLGAAGTSLIAGTATLPFAAYHFGTAALYYVPANLLAVPLTAFWVLPWGLVALALMPLGLERLGLVPMGWGIGLILDTARFVAGWPGAVIHVPAAPPWGLALVAGGMGLLALLRSPLRLAGIVPLGAGLLSPFLVAGPDAVVGPDARLIAVRDGAGAAVLADRPDPFEAEAPTRVWGDIAPHPPACGPAACDIRLALGTVRLVRARPAPCAGAAVLLSAEPLRGDCPGVPVVDRFTVYRQGAAAITLVSGGARITTEAERAGRRPWTALPRPGPSLPPPAATE